MRNYFIFGGKDSRDYGVYLSGAGTYNSPAREYQNISIPGRDGDLLSTSINLGGGVKINHVEIRVNYNSALGKTADAEFTPTIDSDGIHLLEPKSNAWQIGLTYYF